MNINEDIRFEDFILSFKAVWYGKLICIMCGFIFFALGIFATLNADISNYYTAYTTVYSYSYGDVEESSIATSAMNSYADIATSQKVCERAASLIDGYSFSAGQISNMINVSASTSVVMKISATYVDGDAAIAVANAVAEAFVIEMKNVTGTDAVQLLDSANYAYQSTNGFKDLWTQRIMFFFVGFILAAAVIFVKELFSNKVRLVEQMILDENDFVLGIIPEINEDK